MLSHTTRIQSTTISRGFLLLLVLSAIFMEEVCHVKADFGNEFQLGENERVVYEEEGYVEIQVEDLSLEDLEADGNDQEAHSDAPDDSHRLLYEEMSEPRSKSNLCKTKCIDRGLNYCPTDNYEGGVCCHPGEICPAGTNDYDPRFYQSATWCSNHNEDAPARFKLLVCPNEDGCGDGGRKFIEPPLDGEVITRAVEKYEAGKLFLDNDVCAWVIRNPAGMGARDWMWVEITEVSRSLVYVAKAYQYKYRSRNRPKLAHGTKFGMLRGLDYYVIGQSVSPMASFFKLRTWIERHEPPPDAQDIQIQPQPDAEPTPELEDAEFLSDNENDEKLSGGETNGHDQQDGRSSSSGGSTQIKLNSLYFEDGEDGSDAKQNEGSSPEDAAAGNQSSDDAQPAPTPSSDSQTTQDDSNGEPNSSQAADDDAEDSEIQDHRQTLAEQEEQQAIKKQQQSEQSQQNSQPENTSDERHEQYEDSQTNQDEVPTNNAESTDSQSAPAASAQSSSSSSSESPEPSAEPQPEADSSPASSEPETEASSDPEPSPSSSEPPEQPQDEQESSTENDSAASSSNSSSQDQNEPDEPEQGSETATSDNQQQSSSEQPQQNQNEPNEAAQPEQQNETNEAASEQPQTASASQQSTQTNSNNQPTQPENQAQQPGQVTYNSQSNEEQGQEQQNQSTNNQNTESQSNEKTQQSQKQQDESQSNTQNESYDDENESISTENEQMNQENNTSQQQDETNNTSQKTSSNQQQEGNNTKQQDQSQVNNNANQTQKIQEVVQQQTFGESFRENQTVYQILLRDTLNLKEAPSILHIYFSLAVLGGICLCCCSVCCFWLCILKPRQNKVKSNQTTIMPFTEENHDDEMNKKFSGQTPIPPLILNDYERWTDDGRTDAESQRTDRQLINKHGLNANFRTSILNKISTITNGAKQYGKLDPEKQKELRTLITLLESHPTEQETNPNQNYNRLFNGSKLASQSNDGGTHAHNTLVSAVNPFALKGTIRGSPMINKAPIGIMDQMDRPQTHQGNLQNDIYENALKLVGQDNRKSFKRANPQSVHRPSEYEDQLKEINDYLKEQEYANKPHLLNTPPFNLNDGRQSWNLQPFNETSKFRMSDLKRTKTLKPAPCKKEMAHETSFGCKQHESIQSEGNHNLNNSNLSSNQRQSNSGESEQIVASDGHLNQQKSINSPHKLEFEPSFKRGINSEGFNCEDSASHSVKQETSLDEQINRLNDNDEHPSGFCGSDDKKEPLIHQTNNSDSLKDNTKYSLIEQSLSSQHKEGGQQSIQNLKRVLLTLQKPPIESDEMPMPPLQQVSEQVTVKSNQVTNNNQEVNEPAINYTTNGKLKEKITEKLKLKSLRQNNQILDMQILQSPKKRVVEGPKQPVENNQKISFQKPLKSLRESSQILSFQIQEKPQQVQSTNKLLECQSKVIPLEDICQRNEKQPTKNDSCESKKESQEENEKSVDQEEVEEESSEQSVELNNQTKKTLQIVQTNEFEADFVNTLPFQPLNDSAVDTESWVNTGMFQLINEETMNVTRTETVVDSSFDQMNNTQSLALQLQQSSQSSDPDNNNDKAEGQKRSIRQETETSAPVPENQPNPPSAKSKKKVTFIQDESEDTIISKQKLSESSCFDDDSRDSTIEMDEQYKQMAKHKGKDLHALKHQKGPNTEESSRQTSQKVNNQEKQEQEWKEVEAQEKRRGKAQQRYLQQIESLKQQIQKKISEDKLQSVSRQQQQSTIGSQKSNSKSTSSLSQWDQQSQKNAVNNEDESSKKHEGDSSEQIESRIEEKLKVNVEPEQKYEQQQMNEHLSPDKAIQPKRNRSKQTQKSREKKRGSQELVQKEPKQPTNTIENQDEGKEVVAKEEPAEPADTQALPDIFNKTQSLKPNVDFGFGGFADIDIENVDWQQADEGEGEEEQCTKPKKKTNWHLLEPDDSEIRGNNIEYVVDPDDQLVTDKQKGFYPTMTGLKFNPHILDVSEDQEQKPAHHEKRAADDDPTIVYEKEKLQMIEQQNISTVQNEIIKKFKQKNKKKKLPKNSEADGSRRKGSKDKRGKQVPYLNEIKKDFL